MQIKLLVSLKPFANTLDKKTKYCMTCESMATEEACFDVGEGITVVEKYCKKCTEQALR